MSKRIQFIFAHGAGAGKDSEWMQQMAKLLSATGATVSLFDFPYMKIMQETGKRRPPDKLPKLLNAYQEAINALHLEDKKLVIGGKSMGGRVASLLAAEPDNECSIAGLVCFGYPFYAPNKPDVFRAEHLLTIKTPTLICQGERDHFGGRAVFNQHAFSTKVSSCILPDGDHSFKPRKKSGVSLTENLTAAATKTVEFFDSL